MSGANRRDGGGLDVRRAGSAERLPDVFFRSLSTPIVLVLLAIGLHFLLRGHNAPGGGFIAGLVVAVAALLSRMANERPLLALPPLTLVPLGLLVAAFTGVAPMLVGREFLTSAHGPIRLPVFGQLEWASAALFDLGVFLVVVGTTLTVIDLLATDAEPERLGFDAAAGPEGATADPSVATDDRTDREAGAGGRAGREQGGA